MALARPASDQERLPWLDSRVRRRRRDPRPLLIALFAISAFLAVGGLSYWVGQRSVGDAGDIAAWPGEDQVDHSVSQELPQAIIEPPAEEAPPEPETAAAAAPAVPAEAQQQPVRPVERPRPKPVAAERRKVADPPARRREAAARAAKPKPAARPAAAAPRRRAVRQRRSGYWPTPATAVRLQRVIQIGVFSSSRRAHDAWLKTLRRYPQTRGLPRISSAYEAKNGRTYHRVQIMTTAPAQSQWLCRKMRADGRRCTVLGSRK